MLRGETPIAVLARELGVELPLLVKFCNGHKIPAIAEGCVSGSEVERVGTVIVIQDFKRKFGENSTHSFQLHVGKGLLSILIKNAIITDSANNQL